ncbi:hypothetical protein [Undibacterium sp. TJN19]|uniref:hypothetical protein n=1 Tax=Undibacterium sp. TJN19 TaxID=3413055 RepID=UPI003BF04A96
MNNKKIYRPLALLRKSVLPGLVVSLAAGLSSSLAWADQSSALDRISLSGGVFYADPSINFNADTRFGRIQTPTYDQDHVQIPRVRADMLLGDSQGLSFDYFRYDKSYLSSVSGQATINDKLVTGAASLSSDLRLEVGQFAYRWWFGGDNDVVGVGLGAAFYRARLDGIVSGTVDGNTASASDSVSKSTVAPLLELGWRHAFSKNFRFFAEASGIKKNGGSVSGNIYGGNAGVEWFPFQNVGLVADYGVTKIDLMREHDNANMNIRLAGPSAYVKVRF